MLFALRTTGSRVDLEPVVCELPFPNRGLTASADLADSRRRPVVLPSFTAR